MAITLTDDYPFGTANGNACYLCGAAPRKIDGRPERVVDLGESISYEGWLCICESCWTDGARLLGMETPAVLEGLRQRLAAAEDALLTSEGRAAEAEDMVVSMRRYDEHRRSTEDATMAEAMSLRPAPPKPRARPSTRKVNA